MSSRAAIESLQLERLNALILSIPDRNLFYTNRLSGSGVAEGFAGLIDYSTRVPFTTKEDLVRDREDCPPYGTNLSSPLSAYSRFCQSSGTTRGAMPWLDTEASWSAMLDCWDRVYQSAGIDSNQTIYFAFSFGPFLGFWTAFESATRRGNLCLPGGGLSSMARLKMMATHRCQVLCCTPTYAIRLGELWQEVRDQDEFAELGLEKIIVAGEPGGSIASVRRRLSDLWMGVRIVDHHGMTETGPVTYEHPDKPLILCVIEEAYYAEIIDCATQQEVGLGEQGELVLTTLTRGACPLLRYRTGDLVQKSYVGDTLCLEGGILGRIDEMVVIRGVNIYPAAVGEVISNFSEISEYQVTQSTVQAMAELEISIEPVTAVAEPGELAKRVSNALQDAFNLRIPVTCKEPGALPRFEFKSNRWVKQDN